MQMLFVIGIMLAAAVLLPFSGPPQGVNGPRLEEHAAAFAEQLEKYTLAAWDVARVKKTVGPIQNSQTVLPQGWSFPGTVQPMAYCDGQYLWVSVDTSWDRYRPGVLFPNADNSVDVGAISIYIPNVVHFRTGVEVPRPFFVPRGNQTIVVRVRL